MMIVWSTLAPLIIASALVPMQIVVTILLLQSTSGRRAAIAFVAGMTAVRLVQGVVFGLILSSSEGAAATSDGSSVVASILLVVMGVLLLVTALRHLLAGDDPDAAPPRWLEATASMVPGKAFLFGAGLLAIGAKFWVFTMSAIGVINEADLSRSTSILTFFLFAVLATSVQLALIGVAVAAPTRSDALLEGASGWLSRNNRVMMIAIGLVFGVWFLVKGLDGLGLW